ncbi:carboxypeptidase regulatory-like domain-containing protein, partial [candidate division KSB1 bacterium]|nr:carboxypeptidase regulatory-like domain-containing protein [candidate division KSB1 bacterium]
SGAQQNGTIAEDWPQPLFSDSRGELKITMSGTKALQGEGVLIYVGFQVSPGAPVETRTELLISRVVLNDGTPLPTGITSGSITILQGNVEEQVTVSIPDTSAVSDFSLLLPVMVSDLSGFKIYSFTTTLEFDPEVMQVFGIDTSGCLISHWPLPFFNLSGNSIQIDASGVTAPAGSGVLFYLKIRTLPRLISGTTGRIKFLNFSFNDYYPGVKPTDGSVFLLARYDVIWGYAEDESAKTPVDSVLVVAEPGGLEYLTEPDGYFEFTELDTSVGFTLAAFKNGYVSTPVEGVQAGGENIKIYLQRNDGYIDGKVRDKNNKIVIGALVIANNNARSFGSANTDSSGYFRITGLAKSSLYTVRASKYGFYDRVVENVAVNTTMDIRLDFQFGTVTGQLTFIDGKPNRIAQMVLDDIIDPDISFKTEVKDDGTYQFQQIPAGEYILKVFLPGYVSEPGQMQFTLPPAGSFQADFSLEKAVLYRIVIQGKTEIPNNEPAAYEAVALTENDRQMSIEEPLWLLSPEKAGTPDSLRNGLLIPNPSYFGHTVLVAVDISSGITDTLDIDIYAPVDKNTHAVYENDAGITLSVLPGCFSGQQKLKIQTVELPPFKKNAKSATAHGNGYWLKPDGLALDQPVLLSFPFQNSKNNSRITIGLWDKQDAQWAFQQKVPAEADMVSSTVSSLGLYAVLVKSRPLGIEQIKYLPNPFSPDIDTDNDGYTGLSIHLKVTSLSSRTPFVTITVYSMLGIRLRDIAVRQPLIKDNDNIVHWDGRTDDGLLARNGRYIIRTTVEDASGTEEHVGTVVLVR